MKLLDRQHKKFAILVGIILFSILLLVAGDSVINGYGSITSDVNNSNGYGSITSGANKGKGCKKVGVLLPEKAPSVRWDSKDRPLLTQDIQNALPGVTVDYSNAEDNADEQQSQAKADVTKGDCILVVAPVDGNKATTIVTSAKISQVPVIAYDRLIQSKDLNYYVSFDNAIVGELQGQYIIDHYKDYGTGKSRNMVMINGSPTDANAILLRQSVLDKLQPLFDNGTLKKVYDQYTPNWANDVAGTEMDGALILNGNNIQIAYVANDDMADSVIASLKAQHLNGKVLVTGQDATVAGIQNILTGDQSMTIYKAIAKEAQATAQLVAAISHGIDISSLIGSGTTRTSDGGSIPSILETPVVVDKSNIAVTVIADGFVTKTEICKGLPAGTNTEGICL